MKKNKTGKILPEISLTPFLSPTGWGRRLSKIAPLLDAFLGVNQLDKFHRTNQLRGLSKEDYCDTAIRKLNIQVEGSKSLVARIPKTGPVVVVANHPCGGIEGVILARELSKIRPDTKILANKFLSIFSEIKDYFIFTNPLNPKDPKNLQSLKTCHAHIQSGGLLLVFPAGKVSYFRKDKQRIADGEWNRLPGRLAIQNRVPLVTLYVDGRNSSLFYFMGRIYSRFRLVMLPREFLKQRNQTIALVGGSFLSSKVVETMTSGRRLTGLLRALTYIHDPKMPQARHLPKHQSSQWKPLAKPLPRTVIKNELSSIPPDQMLYQHSQFSVYYGYQKQIPKIVEEIGRLREQTFRALDEGSGEPMDTDEFDATYTQLFVYDHERDQILGAYRMGQTDLLAEPSDFYLSQMFDFGENFINQQKPCLEMGRSFVSLEYQKNLHGLGLLWKGIGAFIKKHPRYEVLYGTVSLSPQFSPHSLALMQRLIPMEKGDVKAKSEFRSVIHPEMLDYIRENKLGYKDMSPLIRILENDQRDVPVLFKQYQRLGAKFYTIGTDENFNNTPGLLLSVDIKETPPHILKRYMGTVPEFHRARDLAKESSPILNH